MDSNVGFIDTLLVKAKLSELNYLRLLRASIYNWHDVALVRSGIKKSALLRFKDGSKFKLTKSNFLGLLGTREVKAALFRSAAKDANVVVKRNTIEFTYRNRRLQFHYDKSVYDVFTVLREVFIDENYAPLNVQGEAVIDIGAYIGDTAIYFLLRGAKHVYAVETNQKRVVLARRNIKANGFESKVTLIPKAASLSEIMRTYKLDSAVLKCDCDGCEYGLLLGEEAGIIRSLKQIQLEYTFGYSNLEKRLRSLGFRVSHTVMNIPESSFFGLLCATRTKGKN